MTRTLKTFMKAKRGICSKKCECLTINMWRCMDEFCGCGDNNSNSVNPNIQPSPAPAPRPAPTPTPVEPDESQISDENGEEPEYISLDELNS